MLEGEISLSDIKELKFVKHHPVRCSMKRRMIALLAEAELISDGAVQPGVFDDEAG